MFEVIANCYLCNEEKECVRTLIYDKGEYHRVYICLECYKKRYGEINKGVKKVNLRDRPYLDVEVVEVKTKEYIPKGCRGCKHRVGCTDMAERVEEELKHRKGTWVNGENLDKIEFPCVCSYRKNQELKYGTLDKVFSDGSFGIILRELKQIKEGWYPGTYEAYYDAVDFEALIKCWDIHIEKAKIVIFKETK